MAGVDGCNSRLKWRGVLRASGPWRRCGLCGGVVLIRDLSTSPWPILHNRITATLLDACLCAMRNCARSLARRPTRETHAVQRLGLSAGLCDRLQTAGLDTP